MKAIQKLSDTLRRIALRDVSLTRLCVTCVAVFVLLMLCLDRPERFIAPANLSSMMRQMPELGVLTLAVSFALFLGGIDLSVVSTANLSSIISATLTVKFVAAGTAEPLAVALSYVAALVVGALCGLFNGLVVSYAGVPAMLATLGTMELYEGVGLVLTNGSAVTGLPSAYGAFGSAAVLGIPVIMLVFLLAIVVASITMQRRKFGLDIYLLGTNDTAAQFSGINNNSVTIKAFVCSGVLAALAGIIISSRVMTARADYGSSYILQCLLVAILGGISPFGGFGRVVGILVALITLQMLSSGFNMMRLSSYQTQAVYGALLIAVMVMNYLMEKCGERRRIKKALKQKM